MRWSSKPGAHRKATPRRRWPRALAATLTAVVLAGAVTALVLRSRPDRVAGPLQPPPAGRAEAPQNGPVARAACAYERPSGGTAPTPPGSAPRAGAVPATLHTSLGDIVLQLDADAAPCTVNSFAHLAASGFYTGSPCHRLTTAGIFVLQCGDPTATGTGGPGYRFGDENLPVNAAPPYPRGTVAMANAGPDTNGSQFFIVYRDGDMRPDYPIFGKVTSGLEILDRVAASGAPNNDGAPNTAITITSIDVG